MQFRPFQHVGELHGRKLTHITEFVCFSVCHCSKVEQSLSSWRCMLFLGQSRLIELLNSDVPKITATCALKNDQETGVNWEYLEISNSPEKTVKNPRDRFLRCIHNRDQEKSHTKHQKLLFWYHVEGILQNTVFTEVTHVASLCFSSCLLFTYYRGQCLDAVCADKLQVVLLWWPTPNLFSSTTSSFHRSTDHHLAELTAQSWKAEALFYAIAVIWNVFYILF